MTLVGSINKIIVGVNSVKLYSTVLLSNNLSYRIIKYHYENHKNSS